MTQRDEHENYLLKAILSHSITSENPSKEAKEKARMVSPSYFEQLKQDLLNEYEGKSLSDIKGSRVVSTEYGDTLKIVEKGKISFSLKNNDFKSQINSNLKLLPTIGVKKEQTLKSNGYDTIESLKNHDRYGDVSSRFLDSLDDMSFCELMDLLNNNRYSKDCKNNLIKCLSLCDIENLKFMDIETLGLSNVPVILIGVAEIKNSKIISTQYFLRDVYEEAAVLDGYLSHLDEDSVHVTFNGKSFDVPFIRNRCMYNGVDVPFRLAHIDLMHFAKNLWANDLPNCQLQTIEKEKFGIERVGDVPGQYIPGYYNTYLSEENIGPIVPIIEHNRQDIVSLAGFLEKMYDEVNYF